MATVEEFEISLLTKTGLQLASKITFRLENSRFMPDGRCKFSSLFLQLRERSCHSLRDPLKAGLGR
jgi:hypothetical protein